MTYTPAIMIATDCPDADCDWITWALWPENTVFTHLVEKHGYVDTTAHVMAHEVAYGPSTPEDTGRRCKHCNAALAIYDDPFVWEDTHSAEEGGTGAECPVNPTGEHQVEQVKW